MAGSETVQTAEGKENSNHLQESTGSSWGLGESCRLGPTRTPRLATATLSLSPPPPSSDLAAGGHAPLLQRRPRPWPRTPAPALPRHRPRPRVPARPRLRLRVRPQGTRPSSTCCTGSKSPPRAWVVELDRPSSPGSRPRLRSDLCAAGLAAVLTRGGFSARFGCSDSSDGADVRRELSVFDACGPVGTDFRVRT